MVQDPTAPVSAVVVQLNEKNVICGDDAGGRTALEAALYWNDGVLFKALIRHTNFDVVAVIRRAVLLYQFDILRRMIKAGGLSTEGASADSECFDILSLGRWSVNGGSAE